MTDNALASANYFIDLSKRDNIPLTQLGLMKRVYIAYGFALAILNRSIIDKRFDSVEAWRYGPVIPCVYHSFKHYGNEPIKKKTEILRWDGENKFKTSIPKVEDKDIRKVIEFVWERYKGFSDSKMVSMTHKEGTPWSIVYVPNKNKEIPEEMTSKYYKILVSNIRKAAKTRCA